MRSTKKAKRREVNAKKVEWPGVGDTVVHRSTNRQYVVVELLDERHAIVCDNAGDASRSKVLLSNLKPDFEMEEDDDDGALV